MYIKTLLLSVSIGVVCGCAAPVTSDPPPIVVGSDSDVHGCKASAGYEWCALEQDCVRSWELARAKGFERGDHEAFKAYCEVTE